MFLSSEDGKLPPIQRPIRSNNVVFRRTTKKTVLRVRIGRTEDMIILLLRKNESKSFVHHLQKELERPVVRPSSFEPKWLSSGRRPLFKISKFTDSHRFATDETRRSLYFSLGFFCHFKRNCNGLRTLGIFKKSKFARPRVQNSPAHDSDERPHSSANSNNLSTIFFASSPLTPKPHSRSPQPTAITLAPTGPAPPA